MADSPSRAPTPTVSDPDTTHYWCYHCNKRVSVETLANQPDVICCECKNGFVESIQSIPAVSSGPPSLSPDLADDPSFGSQFLQVLRLLAQAARDGDPSPPLPQDPQSEDDFLRIELNGWVNDEEDDDDDEDEEEDANENDENRADQQVNGDGQGGNDRSDNENENENRDGDDEDDEEDLRRRRRDVLRLRIRDFTTRARSGRNRILDWAEILMGLEDNSIEFHLEVPESDRYIGNPEDYVDAAGYETLLQNLAESDGGRRGAPPAAKSAISALPTVEIATEADILVCAICKDMMSLGERATKLPCGHGYHGDCIMPWLGTRNSCPLCRFELPTDDPEYEEEKNRRDTVTVGGASGGDENSSTG